MPHNPKPVLAWGIVTKCGRIIPHVSKYRSVAEGNALLSEGERVVRVEIRVVKKGAKRGKA